MQVILDEAYIEFAGEGSRIKWVQRYDNLVVLRTFSKSAALAGLRVGYGAFPLGMVEYLWRAKQPYNVSVAAETAACAALTNMPYLDKVGGGGQRLGGWMLGGGGRGEEGLACVWHGSAFAPCPLPIPISRIPHSRQRTPYSQRRHLFSWPQRIRCPLPHALLLTSQKPLSPR